MKTHRLASRPSLLPACALALTLATPLAASAAVPPRVPVQGVVTDVDGVALDATYDVVFSLYETAEGGTPFFTEVQAVAFESGFFATYLGDTVDVPIEEFPAVAAVYLGIAIDGDDEMDRIEIATAPFAAFAQFAASAGDAATLGGAGPSAFAAAVHTTSWSDIVGVPPGLADGDDDTTVTAYPGGGIEIADGFVRLLSGCVAGEILEWNGTAWRCATDDEGGDATDELVLSFTFAGTTLTLRDAGGTYALDLAGLRDGVNDADANPDNETITAAALFGTQLVITEAGDNWAVELGGLRDGVNDADADPTNESVTVFAFAGTTLTLTESGVPRTVDLASLRDGVNDADSDPFNELITDFALSGTLLSVTEGGVGQSVDLASLRDGVNDADADPTNERITGVSLTGTQLRITEAGVDRSVDLASLRDGNTTYSAGFGIDLSGTTFTADTSEVQRRVSGTCATIGDFVWGVDSAGGVSCRNVFGQPQSTANVHFGPTGLTGQAEGWQPSRFGSSGVWIEGGSSESGGFYADGDTAAIWSPGDASVTLDNGTAVSGVLLALFDEDGLSAGSTARASFAFSDFDTRRLAVDNGAYLSSGGVWTNTSDRSLKSDVVPVDIDAILDALVQLEISAWAYDAELQDGFRHIGPMAQDFFAAFGFGYDERSIATVDADGVALAAIQALARRNAELGDRVIELEQHVVALEDRLARIEAALQLP